MTNLLTDNIITSSISLSNSEMKSLSLESNSDSFSPEDLVTDSFPIKTTQSQKLNTAQILIEVKIKATERFVYDKINEGNSQEVRHLLCELEGVSSPLLLKWKKAFCREMPKRTGKASLHRDEINKDSEWLKHFSKNYSSKWVALSNDNVVGVNENLNDLKENIKNLYNIEKITFIKL